MTSDADGNTLTDTSGRSLTWDSQNRMVSCTKAGVISTYTYGADGLRRSSTVNGVTTYYVYDGQTMIREVKRNPQNALVPVVTYLQGPQGGECRIDDTQQTEGYYRFDANNQPLQDAQGQPLIFRRGVTKWYVYDGLGSVTGEVDASGSLTSSPKYDVYGATRGNAGTASSRQGFVGGLGHVSDTETGLVYMRARYYDPQQGRFASEDPARNGHNWFIYVQDNSTNLFDPDGKTAMGDFLDGLATTGAAALCAQLSPAFAVTFICWAVSMAVETIGFIAAHLGLRDAGAMFIASAVAGGAFTPFAPLFAASPVTNVVAFVVGYASLVDATYHLLNAEVELS